MEHFGLVLGYLWTRHLQVGWGKIHQRVKYIPSFARYCQFPSIKFLLWYSITNKVREYLMVISTACVANFFDLGIWLKRNDSEFSTCN